MNIQVDPTRSNLASAMLNSKIRPRAVVGYGVKIFLSSGNIQRSLFCLQRIHQHHRWILMHPFHCHLLHKLYVIMQKKFCLGETWRKLTDSSVMLTKKKTEMLPNQLRAISTFQTPVPTTWQFAFFPHTKETQNAIKWSGTKVSFLTSTP